MQSTEALQETKELRRRLGRLFMRQRKEETMALNSDRLNEISTAYGMRKGRTKHGPVDSPSSRDAFFPGASR